MANEYAGQEGEIADAVRQATTDWQSFIETALLVGLSGMKSSRELAHRDAFRLDAYMTAANARYALHHDEEDLEMARGLCRELLATRSIESVSSSTPPSHQSAD